MKAFLRFLIERSLLVNLITIFVTALGLYGAFAINREAFPNVNLDIIQVDAIYPGTTPEEIERLVITPIEQELKALNGIDKMLSVAFPGSGRITLELDPNANNRQRLASDVQLAVNRATLPQDLPDDPLVTEIDGTVFPIIQLAVSAPRAPVEMKRLGDQIQDELLDIPGIARVVIQGERKEEIRVVVDPARMRAERISAGEVAALLSNWNVTASGGDLDTAQGQKAVRIVGEFRGPEDVANLVLRANERGGGVRLGDVATVTTSLDEPRVIYDVAGESALAMIVLKKSDADIIHTVDKITAYMKTVPERHGADVKVEKFQDFSLFARMRLGVLTGNGFQGLILVALTLVLFLRPSVALSTAWGMPVVFFAGLFVLYLSGVTLNLISMLGFIIVLGMLVDDSIVVGENITYHMEKGMKPIEAAVHGTYEMMGPVSASVMTTIVAFLPLMFMTGVIGKFIIAIPIVVMLLLFFSWIEAFLVLPNHIVHVANTKAHPPERAWLAKFEEGYARALAAAVRHRWLTVTISLAVLIGSFVLAATAMSFQLFPSVAVDQYIVRATATPGTSIETMRARLIEIDREIRARIDSEHLEATLLSSGQVAIDENDALMQRGGRFGQIRVIYTPAVSRPEHDALQDMQTMIKAIPPLFPDLDIAISEIKGGPPTGRPLQVEIAGHDTQASEAAARRLIELLEKVPGVTDVDSGLKPGDPELHVVFDRALAAYAGVDLATAANHVRAAVGGWRVSTVRRGTEEVDVTIRFPEGAPDRQVKNLHELRIPNDRGGLVPLARIARFDEHPGFTTIRHKAGIRVVNVVADVNTSAITSAELNALVAQREVEWLGDARGKVQVNYGGEAEKNAESFKDLAISFLFALIGIFFILAIQFHSLSYPIMVMLAIPFGAVGIILSFFLHDLFQSTPLSFFAALGFVALSGVVVNSSLVLLVFIQRAIKDGMEAHEAIITAGRRRLRAVILTAGTTVMGLLPTAYGWGGKDPFVAPMALALAWGLVFATLLTLITIPAFLAAGMDVKAALQRVRARLAVLGRSGDLGKL
jgi:multidrug efflux pump subunit AcrB